MLIEFLQLFGQTLALGAFQRERVRAMLPETSRLHLTELERELVGLFETWGYDTSEEAIEKRRQEQLTELRGVLTGSNRRHADLPRGCPAIALPLLRCRRFERVPAASIRELEPAADVDAIDEAEELTSLFHFFETTLGLQGEKCLTFDSFAEGTLANTPLGKLRVAAFQSAVRGMTADVKKAQKTKPVAVS